MSNILAYDRVGTVRTFDEDGRLRVAKTPISKANVCPYRGNEIPRWDKLGLDPERVYRLLRSPEELERAVHTFNGLPVLEEHHHVTAVNPRRDLVVGTTGNEASFETPFLYNSLVIWDGVAIDRIKSGEQRELSSAYRYEADMTPGEYQGEPYDGVMRNISGSHVAVVPTGRAGPDVLVADAKPESIDMPKKNTARRDKLLATLKPFLANDADMEAAKKAMDEDMDEDMNGATDSADFEAMAQKMRDAGMSEDDIAACRALCEAQAQDTDENARRAKLREAGLTDDEIEKCMGALAVTANDETEEERRAREAAGAAQSDEERARREKEDREREAAGARRADEERQTAMDAALARVARETEARTIKRMNDLHAARDAVKPFVGSVAMDSAEGVYGFALKQEGYDLSGIPGSAYRAMFTQHVKNKASASSSAPKIAGDSAASLGFLDKFPGLKAVKVKA